MSDPWVLKVQQWVNSTYGSRAGFVPAPTNGRTGWPTMDALVMALQSELGISPVSDAFGPTTQSKVAAISPIGASSPLGIRKVLQAAFYCKGYDSGDGDITGIWADIGAAVNQMKRDIGLSVPLDSPPGSATIDAKLVKSLFTMDAYVLVDGGKSGIRTIQRDLNARYWTRQDFPIMPADGIYSRNVQQGLMYALQYEIGMTDGVANGNFGPGTKQGIRDLAGIGVGSSDGAKYFVHLFQAALTFNGYPTDYTGMFTSSTSAATKAFQSFSALASTGVGDFQTWASLLVSTGDTERQGRAADMASEITPARAAALVAHGYRIVGRYLTNTPVNGALDKNIKPGEIAAVFNAGLRLFPIFQEGGFELSYFSYDKGILAGDRAHAAASSYGFLPGTTIYFAVDFDAQDDEITDVLIPHFRGIRDALNSIGSPYRIGVYGPRNTCTRISNAGLAALSWASGMSWGFSGNLGFPLPWNWAFDQILEYEIPVGDGTMLAIDKDIVSGRDQGQSTVAPPPTVSPKQATFDFINTVDGLANAYDAANPVSDDRVTLAFRQLRSYESDYVGGPSGAGWAALGGVPDVSFGQIVSMQVPDGSLPASFDRVDRSMVGGLDYPHLFATACAYRLHGTGVGSASARLADFGGWGGDMTTLMAEYIEEGRTEDPYAFASTRLADLVDSSFGSDDLRSDAMGWLIARRLEQSPSAGVVSALDSIIDTAASTRVPYVRQFALERWSTRANALASLRDAWATFTSDLAYQQYRDAVFAAKGIGVVAITNAERDGFSEALLDALFA